MRVLIIEDELPAARRVERLLKQAEPAAEILAVLDSVAAALVWLERATLDRSMEPEVLLLDIELADGSAFELFERRSVEMPVIFCTAYNEHAIRAFKVNSIDYLLKPVTREALAGAFAKLRRLRQALADGTADPQPAWPEVSSLASGASMSRKSRFLVKKGQHLHSVPVTEVAFFWTSQKLVRLVTRGGESFFVDLSLDELEQMLDPDAFFRISRQVLLAFAAIDSVRVEMSRLHIETTFETRVPLLVSRDRSSIFRAWLDR